MAAAPFKATIVLRPVSGGPPRLLALSASDVANAFVTNDADSLTYINVPVATGGYVIEDLQLSASGTDTTKLQIVVDGNPKEITFRNSFLAATAPNSSTRVPPGIAIPAGSQFQLKQIA